MNFFIKLLLCLIPAIFWSGLFGQDEKNVSKNAKETSCNPACLFIEGDAVQKKPLQINSFIDAEWEGWKERTNGFGVDREKMPRHIYVNAPISTDSTIIVRGENAHKKRWGLHAFEAYAYDQISRLTMVLNKHIEEEMPVAEIYYFGTAYSQDFNAYYWVRIGSDVPYRSYMFSRDHAIFYGVTELRNLLVLDSVSRKNLRKDKLGRKDRRELFAKFEKENDREKFASDMDYKHAKYGEFYKEELKWQRYGVLQKAKDGSIFYDEDLQALVVKVGGKWMKAKLEPLPEDYNFDNISENK